MTRGSHLRQDYVVAVIYVAALFMTIMDSSIVNTALPSIARQFATTPAATEWVIIGYLLSLAVWIPASGWVGDRLGTKVTFLFALGLFTLASALCGLAGSLTQLVVFRILQGVGGGMLAPVGQAMLFRAFPPERRVRASMVLFLGTTLAPATGPVLGGVLVTKLSWRWCFYVNLPIGIAAFVFGLLFVIEHREPAAGRFDVAGFVLSGAGLALFLYAVSEGPNLGWGSAVVLGTGVAGVAALVALVLVELHQQAPMLFLWLFSNRIFRTANIISIFSTGAVLGYLFVVPQFLQNARGASALSSGLTTFPGAIGVIISSQIAGRLYHYVGPRRLVVPGLIGATIGLSSLTFVGLHTSAWFVRLIVFCVGSCNAYVFLPLQSASFASISSSDMGRGSAIFSAQNQVGAAIGVGVLGTVVASSLHTARGVAQHPSAATLVTAYHHAFLTAASFTLVAALLACTIRDRDAAPTMRPRARRQRSR